MALATFTHTPQHPYQWSPSRPTIAVSMAGGGEQRASLYSRTMRRYPNLRFKVRPVDQAALEAFFEARGYTLESFLWVDLKESTRSGVSIGTGTGALTAFELPVTGVNGGDYPTGGVTLYADGVPASGSFDTDTRTFTFDSAPANLAVLTADYTYARRVRLEGAYTWDERVYEHYWLSLSFVEVPNG